jgi:hypothetical protein
MATPTEQTLRPDTARILGNSHHDAGRPPTVHRIVIPGREAAFKTYRQLPLVPPGSLVVISGATSEAYRFGQTLADAIDDGRAGTIALEMTTPGLCVVLWSQLPSYHPGQSFRIP